MNSKHIKDCRRDNAKGTQLEQTRPKLINGWLQDRRKHGFSTIELVVSLGMFLMLSVIISLAVARTLGATANSRALRAAESVAVDSLTALGSTDYGTLIEGNFPVPNPCDENNATGINATTCVDVGNIPVEIGYSYQTMDVNGVATCSNTLSNGTATATKYAFVGLCANIKTIGGSEAPEDIITPTRHINSPSPEYAPDGGVVRVAITGDYSNLLTGNSLYLVRANNPSSLVGTGAVDPTTGMAYIATVGYTGTGSGEPNACIPSNPCMLALTTGGSPSLLGTTALYGPDARAGANILTPKGGVTDASVNVAEAPKLRMDLFAVNGNDRAALEASTADNVNDPKSSVCVWATINDSGEQKAALCNSITSGAILATSYTPLGSNISWPLPAGGQATITTDHPGGNCPNVGQKGYAGPNFVPAAVCTSWTWGSPANLPAKVNFATEGQTTYLPLTWTPGPAGSPAAGWPEKASPLWAHPRNIDVNNSCATTGTCGSVVVPPEPTWCPEGFCRHTTNTPPYLTSPKGPLTVATGTSLGTAATITAFNPNSNPSGNLNVYLLSTTGTTSGAAVPQGTLTINGQTATVSGSTNIGQNATGKSASWKLNYSRPGNYAATFNVNFRLCPNNTTGVTCSGGATRTVTINSGTSDGTLTAENTAAAQGADTSLQARLTDVSNNAVNGAPVTFTVTGGNAVASPKGTGGSWVANTDSTGVAILPITIANGAAAGPVTFTAVSNAGTAGSVTTTATLTVLAKPAAVTVSAPANPSLYQGTKGTATVTVKDGANNAIGGINVSVIVADTDNVYAESGCVTSGSGTCTLIMRATKAATAQTYQMTATAQGVVSAPKPVVVKPYLDSVVVTPDVKLSPGARNVPFTAALYDTTGAPIANTAFNVVGNVMIGPSDPPTTTPIVAVSDNSGVVNLSMSATASAADGEHSLVFSQPNTALTPAPVVIKTVRVSNSQTIVTLIGTPTVAQGSTAVVTVSVTDSLGRPVAGRVVNFTTSTGGLTIDPTGLTDNDGVARVTIEAGRGVEAGLYSISVWTDSNEPTEFSNVTVLQTPDAVSTEGSVTQGGSGSVTFTLLDTAGNPMGTQPWSVAGIPAGLSFSPSVTTGTTNSEGKWSYLFTDQGPTAAGNYTINVSSGASFQTTAILPVIPAISSLTMDTSPMAVPRGQSVTNVATLKDAAGDAVAGQEVNVAWQAGSDPGCPNILSLDNETEDGPAASVNTGSDGTVILTVATTPDCVLGSYTAVLTAGPATTTIVINIVGTTPNAPTNVTVVPGNTGATVSWLASTDNGGTPVTGYVATVYNALTNSVVTTCTTADLTCYTGTTLTNGTNYYARVAATNIAGTGTQSANSATFYPATIPGAPTISAPTGGNGSLTSTWAAPASNGSSPITGYTSMVKPESNFRSNLATNPSVTTGTGAWGQNSNTANPTQDTSATSLDGNSFKVTANAAGAWTAFAYMPITAAANETYSASMMVKRNQTGNGAITLVYFDTNNNVIDSATGTTVTLTANTWTRLVNLNKQTPALTARIGVYFNPSMASVAAGEQFWGDQLLVEKSATVGTYFDGFTPGAQWTGAANQSVSILDTTIRVNLVKNPSFETDTSLWNNHSGATVFSSLDYAYSGTKSLKLSTTAGQRLSLSTGSSTPAYRSPVTQNTSYTYTTYVRATPGSDMTDIRVYVYYYDGAGTQIGSALAGNAAPVNSTGWTQVSNVQTSPVNAVTTAMLVYQNSTAGGSTFYVDGAYIETTATSGSYFDGSNGGQWLGAQDGSWSVKNTTTPTTCTTTGLTCTITGLTNGTKYRVLTTATNAVGVGNPSMWTDVVTPATVVPNAPAAPTAVSGNQQATVTWSAPTDNGGSAITGYTATAYNASTNAAAGTCVTTGALTCTITGLTNGWNFYTKVKATNATGYGPESAQSANVKPATIATAPQNVTGTTSNGTITPTWSAPASDGGSPVTGYIATVKPETNFRTNQATNPSFIGNNGGWTSYTGGSASNVNTSSTPPSSSTTPSGTLRMTSTTTGSAAVRSSFVGENPMTVLPSTNYTFSVDVSTPNAAQTVYATVQWRNGTGTVLGASQTNALAVTVGGTPQRITVNGTTPAGTVYATVILQTVASVPGNIVDIDNVLLTQTATGTTYFDGSTPGAQWTGTPNASVSILDTTARVNLVPNSSFESGTTNYITNASNYFINPNTAGSVTTADTAAVYGTRSVNVNTSGALPFQGITTDVGNLLPSTTYTFSAYVKPTSGSSIRIGVQDTTNVLLGPIVYSTTANTWQRLTSTFTTGPIGPVQVRLGISTGNVTTPNSFNADALLLEQTPSVNTYFDGNTPGAQWLGAQNNSMSTINTTTPATCTTTNLTCTVTGLTNGTNYRVSVSATNAVGTGNPSPWTGVLTPQPVTPDAPTNITAIPQPSGATAAWVAPVNNGGGAITGYTATAYDTSTNTATGTPCTTTGLTCTVFGLTNGTNYYVKVKATNSAGNSADSAQSADITPATVPTAPQNVTGTTSNGTITPSWTAPVNDGGSGITGYVATVKPVSEFRTNLVTNPSLTTNTNDWAGIAERMTNENVVGTAAGIGRFTGTGAASYTYPYTSVTIKGSTKYTASAWMRKDPAITATRNAYVAYEYYDSNNQHITANVEGATVDLPSTWTRISFTPTNPAPANAARISVKYMVITAGTIPTTDNFYIDGALVEEGTTVGTYFDGSTPGAQWTGTPNNSTSILNTTVQTNLIPNPTFTNNVESWTIAAPPINLTVLNGGGPNGNNALQMATQVNYAHGSGIRSADIPIVAGVAYNYTTAVKANVSKNFYISFRWYDSAGTQLLESNTPINVPATTEWVTRTVTATAPAGAVTTKASIGFLGALLGDTYEISAPSITPNGTTQPDLTNYIANTYFTGNTPGAQWLGTQNNSISARNTITPGTCTTTNLTCTVTGLTNGTNYRVSVSATNAVGTGNPSPWTNTLTPQPVTPDAPINITAIAGKQAATVTWGAPTNNGGSAITGYTATAYNSTTHTTAGTCTTTGTLTCTIAGLGNGTTYYIKTIATNTIGNSPASEQSNTVTPYTITSPPQNITGTTSNSNITPTWETPTSNGGSNITGYTATAKPDTGFRTNLNPNPVPVTLTGWATTYGGRAEGTLETTATPDVISQTALKINTASSPDSTAARMPIISVTAGETYTFSTYVKAITGTPTVETMRLGTNGTLTDETSCAAHITTPAGTCATVTMTETNRADAGNGWWRLSRTFTVTNSGNYGMAIGGQTNSTSSTIYITGALIEKTATLGTYFDGNTPGAQWTSGAHTSASILDTTSAVNLVKNPSFETNTNLWTNHDSATWTPSTDYAYTGTKSLQVTTTAGNRVSISTSYRAPVIVGTPYTYSAHLRASPGAVMGGIRIYVMYYNSAGTQIIQQAGPTTTINSTGWTTVTHTQTPPVNAVTTAMLIYQDSVAGGYSVYVDGASITQSATTLPYFDGSNGGQWVGEQDLSWSIKNNAASQTCTTANLTCTIPGLTNGTNYRVSVSATNAAGLGNASPWTPTLTPQATTPDAPTNVTGTSQPTGISTTWAAPGNDGGSAITGYTATAYDTSTNTATGTPCTTTGLSCTVFGLTNGTSYYVKVKATTAIGTSPDSNQSADITPATIPSVPQNATNAGGNGTITPSWSAPASDGGSPVTGYTATVKPETNFRTNQATNPSFTGNNGGWTSYTGGSASNVNTSSTPPSSSTTPSGTLRMTSTTTGSAAVRSSFVGENPMTVLPSTNYTFSVDVSTPNATQTVYATVQWRNGTGTVLGASQTNSLAVTVGGTPQRITVNGTTPAGTVYATVILQTVASVPGNIVDIDNVLLTQTATGTSYFDGSTPGAQWTGTPNASTSILDTTARINLLTNPGGENGNATPWENGNNSVITVTTLPDAPYGTQALKQTTNSAGLAVIRTPLGTAGIPVISGSTYTFSGYVKLDSGAWDTYTRIRWYDTAGTEIPSSVNTSPLTPGSTSFTRVAVTGTAPSNAKYASVQGLVSVDGAAHDTYWDGLMFEQGALGTYFDGNTPGAQWLGTQNNSMSTINTTTPATCTTTNLTCTITNLTPTTQYRTTITATNTAGNSNPTPWSAPIVAAGPPGQPTNITTTPQPNGSTATWNAPADNGGSPITSYTVTAYLHGTNTTTGTPCTTTQLTCSVTGLTNGTEYGLTIKATNAIGTGTETAPQYTIAANTPNAAQNTNLTTTNNNLTGTWTPGSNNGGSPINNYKTTTKTSNQFRTNLTPNPNFDGTGTGSNEGWNPTTPNTANTTATNTQKLAGTHSLALNSTVTGGNVTTTNNYNGSAGLPGITPGQPYTASAWIYTPDTRTVTLNITWIRDNITTGTATPTTQTIPANTWTRLAVTNTTPPATTNKYAINVTANATSGSETAGTRAYLDNTLMEQTTTLNNYFDGNTTNGFWTATTGNSTSLLDTTSRTNLITNPNIDTNGSTWATSNPATITVTYDNNQGYNSPTSLKINSTNSTNTDWGARMSGNLAVVPGQQYTLSGYYKTTIGAQPFLGMTFYDQTGNFAWPRSVAPAATTNEWTRYSTTFTAPTAPRGATNALVTIGTYTTGVDVLWDSLLLEASPTLDTYFDGNTPNAYWTGGGKQSSASTIDTATNSTCTINALTCDLGTNAPNTTYYMKVNSQNGSGWGSASPWTTLTAPLTAAGSNIGSQVSTGNVRQEPTPVAVTTTGALAGKTITQTTMGDNHACALTTEGKAYCWGYGGNGQLGTTTPEAGQNGPTEIYTAGALTGKTITQIDAGGSNACVLTSDNGIYCWGTGTSGQLGNSTNNSSGLAVAVTTNGVLAGKTITKISTGSDYTCVIANSDPYCWGYGLNGRLGNGTTSNQNAPTAVTTTTLPAGTTTDISTGYNHTCAVANNQTYCWGNNANGRLGDGTTTEATTPVAVTTTGVLSGKTLNRVAVGHGHSCVVTTDSTAIYCWGYGSYGQLGNGTLVSSTTPVATTMNGELNGQTITNITANDYNTCATSNSKAYCWGVNTYGQLGNGTLDNKQTTPTAVTATATLAGTNVTSVVSGLGSTCAVASGKAYCWGQNIYGQLGNPNQTVYATTATNIYTSGALAGKTITNITQGYGQACAVADGKAYCWGLNNYGQLGNGTQNNASLPAAVTEGEMSGKTITSLVANIYNTCALTTEGKAYCWGVNQAGQIGDGTTITRNTPVAVNMSGALAGKTITKLTVPLNTPNICALASDNNVYCWGTNSSGQLGDDTTTQRNTPVKVLTSTGGGIIPEGQATDVSTGDGTTCVVAGGNIYCVGSGTSGQLGNGASINATSFVQVDKTGVLAQKTMDKIALGQTHACATDTTGKAYCWGGGSLGRLGNGASTTSNVPVEVTTTGALAGKTITKLSAGTYHTCAITTDGTTNCWGYNYYGQLGTGNITTATTPVLFPTSGLAGKPNIDVATGAYSTMVLAKP